MLFEGYFLGGPITYLEYVTTMLKYVIEILQMVNNQDVTMLLLC